MVQTLFCAPLAVPPNTVSFGFFDPKYSQPPDPIERQHLGVDIASAVGVPVLSPATGLISEYHKSAINESYLYIVEDKTGFYHILGHVSQPTKLGRKVSVGESIGASVLQYKYGSHVHWGINRYRPALTNTWGWGRCPLTLTISEAFSRGWLDPAGRLLMK